MQKAYDGCCHRTVEVRCSDCLFNSDLVYNRDTRLEDTQNMVTFIARNGSAVLWSHGNYQYEIEDRTKGYSEKFSDDYENALLKFWNYTPKEKNVDE